MIVKGQDMSGDSSARRIYRVLLDFGAKTMGAKWAKQADAWLRFGRRLNLKHPRTLADKASWLELNGDQVIAARYTDKFRVREYIESKGLKEILIPVCGGPWDSIDQVDLDSLPEQFVIKATHGCEMNLICTDRSKLDKNYAMHKIEQWLNSDYSRSSVEPHYKLIPHRVYAEEYIGGFEKVIDYKIHCINGKPAFILACSEREQALKLNLYDIDWNPISGLQGPELNTHEIAKPANLNEMIEVAYLLSEDFDFVRVDLYDMSGKINFGELTFSPAAGVFPYFTDSFVAKWGEELHVEGLD